MFTSSSTLPIGLDISDLSIKLVQCKKQGSQINIQALGKIDLPKGLIIDGEIKKQKEIIKAINKIINNPKYGKVTSRNVVACLPETKTFLKLIKTQDTLDNLSNIILSEIEKYVPLSVDELYYDWQIINNTNNVQKILIGAASKNLVDQYIDLLDQAKLSIEALEVEPIAICRALLREESINFSGQYNQNYAILDIGASRTSMSIYAKNTIVFTVSIPISGEKITQDIALLLDIKPSQAEKAKIICGLDTTKAKGVISKILSKTIKDLNQKINKSLKFYNNYFSECGPINNILLCGGGANIKGIDKIIHQSTNINVKKGDALINLQNNKKNKEKLLNIFSEKYNNQHLLKNQSIKQLLKTQNFSLTFTTAIGLALRNIMRNS